jgi:hypothetical protein
MNPVHAIFVLLACVAIGAAIYWYRGHQRDTDPIKLRMRQAAKLKWKKAAEITEDGQGAEWTKRSVRFIRGKEETVLWHKDATITLVRPYVSLDFDDFIELEEFIANYPREPDLDDATGERKYFQEMELFFVRHGYRDDILHIQATDYAFLVAFGNLFKAGYAGVRIALWSPHWCWMPSNSTSKTGTVRSGGLP